MKECEFCGYVGEDWTISPKKKSLIVICPICGNAEYRTNNIYRRNDFDTFDEMMDYLNLNEVRPEHIITVERWTLGFTLLHFSE